MRSKSILLVVMVVCVMVLANIASADLVQGIEIDFVTIGNAGNPGDTRAEANPSGCGAVSYEYSIGKNEIIAAQWQTINTAAGIGNPGTWSGNQPVAEISWYDATRFCNYLTTGDTENGVYKFTGGSLTDIMNHEQAGSTYGVAYFLPTEDEWYKAAYYTGNGYSLYANGTNIAPTAGADANYDYVNTTPWDIGTGTEEQNGTYNMMGNVWEWNETLIFGSNRGMRGGSFWSGGDTLPSSYRSDFSAHDGRTIIGFRVASIPEPATFFLLGLGAVMVRKKHRA